MQPKTQKTEALEAAFNELADKLERQAEYFSFINQRADHLAHQQIVEMGEEAVPLILRRIEQQGGLWYRALESITGIPSPAGITILEAEGRYGGYTVDEKEVNAAWLQWGREQGYQL
jgi:hypothetical protein